MIKRANWLFIALAVAAVVLACGGGYWFLHRAPRTVYATAPVTRGDVITTLSASGTVNPVITVQVGTYVSGTITDLLCDYNTRVRKGQLCAKIDPAPYQIIVDEDQANLATAQAQLVKDQANEVYTVRANQRAALLWKQDSGSRDAADAALNADNQAAALVKLDAAQVAEKAALLKAAQINLNYTNIISPVSGTVVSRNVTAGQTVAASLQTPTLFLIATDLTKMQVDTNVSESDIAGAHEGAGANFTVDAFPKQTFAGQVAQVRQAPISIQNVITYDVVVTVDNPRLQLKPGMTATAKIDTAAARDVIRVPSQALRFTPTLSRNASVKRPAGERLVWVLKAGQPTAVAVKVGLNDETFAEIKSGDLAIGDAVITAESGGTATAKGASRPPATPRL